MMEILTNETTETDDELIKKRHILQKEIDHFFSSAMPVKTDINKNNTHKTTAELEREKREIAHFFSSVVAEEENVFSTFVANKIDSNKEKE